MILGAIHNPTDVLANVGGELHTETMTFLEHISEVLGRLRVFVELDVGAAELPAAASRLSDGSVRELLAEASDLVKQFTTLQAVLAGVASARSARDRGHNGFAQETGHRNAVELLRDLTGATRGEATRAVKVGEALLAGIGADDPGAVPPDIDAAAGAAAVVAARPVWHEPLREALLAGRITTAQHHVIRSGLGEPPLIEGREPDAVIAAWRAAARELLADAAECTVEDLAARARALKNMLDPAGAEERFAARFAQRGVRWCTTAEGLRRAIVTFDDEMGAWVRGMLDSGLAPRRGGPRFVAEGDKAAAEDLVRDSRTNEQLAYDLFIDVLRAGALADADDAYGAKEPGVRLVTMTDAVTGEHVHRDLFDRLVATAHSEDGELVLPGSALERAICATGTVEVTIDSFGNPLDVGRERRLFSLKQRLALGVRDGGCIWLGCDRPPAYCEAHHCDHWADGGRTDCSVGVLLCRFHHLHLHNSGWRISRDSAGTFMLHPPATVGGAPIPLRSKSPLRWLWDPPPDRAGWRTPPDLLATAAPLQRSA